MTRHAKASSAGSSSRFGRRLLGCLIAAAALVLAIATSAFAGAVTEPATEITGAGAKLNGVVMPENEAVSECFFEYGPLEFGHESDYGSTAPCVGETPSDGGAHPVSAVINGLNRGTTYHFRLFVKQTGGEFRGEPHEFEPAGAAPSQERVSAVGINHATLETEINPRGSATSYFFEYGPTSAYGNTTPEEAIGLGEEFLPVSQAITGLTPGATYHWRLVIVDTFGEGHGPDRNFSTLLTSSAPETDCPNQALREFAGAFLPDCRAYEQASPVDKGSVGIEGLLDFFNASPDGSSVSFYSQAYTGMPAGGGAHQNFSTLLASHNGASWSTQRLSQSEEFGENSEFLGLSSDHKYAFVEGFDTLVPGAGLYSIDTSDQSVQTVVPPELGLHEEGEERRYAIDGTSADGSLVFFETRAQILPEAAEGVDNLYLWDRRSGELSVVGVLPGAPEEISSTGSFGGAYRWFPNNQVERGGSFDGDYVEAIHAISPDGDQIYFTAGETGQIYLRKGLRGNSPSTVRVSAPADGVDDPNGPEPAAFQEATPDGTRAFFTSAQKLTSNATTGSSDEGKDLYRWDAADGTLVDVAPDADDPNGAEVLGLIGISSDGSSGYFAAKGKLAVGATAGNHNLYRFAEGPGGSFEIRFVARLSEDSSLRDALNWSPRSYRNLAPIGNSARTARVTPSGDALLFSSNQPLTGYDSDRHTGSAPVQELFRYDADSEQLICVSCSPTNETPKGPAELSTQFLNAFLTPSVGPIPRLTRVMTPDGNRIFFQSPDALVAGDLNSQKKKCTYYSEISEGSHADCLDVYEWEAAGSKSCPTARVNGGCLFLLSSGEDAQASNLVDASADGSSVFIATASKLVPSDRDSLYDVYDVRVNGGLASQHVSPPTPCQSGEACHEASSTPPSTASPGTRAFEGPGNVKQAGRHRKKTCKKGKHSCKKPKKGHHKAKAKPAHKGSKKNGGSK